jgi:hypothetical protein
MNDLKVTELFYPATTFNHEKIRCEGQVKGFTAQWHRQAGREPVCHFSATFCVNGVNLCTRHAGEVVLKRLECSSTSLTHD